MKNRLVQVGLSLTLLGLLVQIVLIAPSQIRDSETKAALLPEPEFNNSETNKDSNVDQSMRGMHMIETTEGQKEWELRADKATSSKGKEKLELDKVKSIFFSESGVTFTVTGEHGTVQVKAKDMRVDGDVIVRSSNGYTFRTDTVEYESKTRRLTAPHKVEMVGPKDSAGHALRLTGVGMRADLNQSSMEILSDVRAEKNIEHGRRALIKSRRSTFSGKNKSARFQDDVVLDLDSMRITGPEARFEYDAKSDVVKSVYVSGGARVSDADRFATAQNVNIDFTSNRFVFRGNPRVVQNNDELRGEEIVFLDNGKQVQVKRARAKVDEKRLDLKK